ncbi:MAG: damage-control phosphatase ARMT1 family protein [Coprobacillaceae bacterium]
MELQTECLSCNVQQVLKVTKNITISKDKQKEIMSSVLSFLSQVDYQLCNPEVMKLTWDIICDYTSNEDPYKEIKERYNLEMLKLYDTLYKIIENSKNPFSTAMKMAILGNIIDFSANHGTPITKIKELLFNAENTELSINHSTQLQIQLLKAKTVVYIGDNCGEIVLDKLFIATMKKLYSCKVYYVVRQKPIINDVTIKDANMVEMEEVATVLSSGDSSLGLVLHHASKEFQALFHQADVIIAKGQGNFEGLQEIKKKNMFHLFMVKCEVMERIINTKKENIVCLHKGD